MNAEIASGLFFVSVVSITAKAQGCSTEEPRVVDRNQKVTLFQNLLVAAQYGYGRHKVEDNTDVSTELS